LPPSPQMMLPQLIQFCLGNGIAEYMAAEHPFGDRSGLVFKIGSTGIFDRYELFRSHSSRFDQLGKCLCILLGRGKDLMSGQSSVMPQVFPTVFACIFIIGAGKPVALSAPPGWSVSDIPASPKSLP